MNREQIDALRASNAERIADLRAKGAEIPSGKVMQSFLQTLLEHVLPEGTPERDAFDEAIERALEEMITEGEQYLARLILQGRDIPQP